MRRVAPRVVDPTDLAAVRTAADADGAVFLPGLLPRARVDALDAAVDGWLRALGWADADGRPLVPTPAYDAPDFVRLQQWVYPSEELDALRRAPALRRVVEALVGGPVRGGRGDLVRVMRAGDPADGTPAHQDAFYVRGEPVLWTVWAPLRPTPLALGPIAVWPGSHHAGERPHFGEGIGTQGIEVPPEAVWACRDLDVGDVVVFGGRTVHRTVPMAAEGVWRRSVDLRFVPG